MAEMVKEEESISLEELGQALKKDGLIDEV
jgi:hypothetical protein